MLHVNWEHASAVAADWEGWPPNSRACWRDGRVATLTWRTLCARSWNIVESAGPLVGRRMDRLRVPARCQCLVRWSKLAFFFRMMSSRRAPWICFPNTRCVSLYSQEILEKSVRPLAAAGWASFAPPRASRCMGEGNGGMKFGRICAQSDEFKCNFEAYGGSSVAVGAAQWHNARNL